jgi:hypothetical protein
MLAGAARSAGRAWPGAACPTAPPAGAAGAVGCAGATAGGASAGRRLVSGGAGAAHAAAPNSASVPTAVSQARYQRPRFAALRIARLR